MWCFLMNVAPVVIFKTLAESFYEATLLMVVYSRCNGTRDNITHNGMQSESAQFYLIYYIISYLVPLLPAMFLGNLADRSSYKILTVIPLLGYLLGRSFLLFTEIFELPIYVMFIGNTITGLCGGYPAYWTGISAITALRSTNNNRSVRLSSMDFTSGMAALLGSILSGHIFMVKNNHTGLPITVLCLTLYTLSVVYSAFIMKYPSVTGSEKKRLLPSPSEEKDMRAIFYLFAAANIFYLGMLGGENVISLFVLKPPLSWDAVWVGYGNAAANMMYFTSFLGVLIGSKYLSDTSLIHIGIVSNCAGMVMMASVNQTYLFFVARGVMMFSCVPLPTMRSQLSKVTDEASYGYTFAWMQSSTAFMSVISTIVFNSVYPITLEWYSGFCLLLSAGISLLSMLPTCFFHFRMKQIGYARISEE
ncbi:thymic stromal cotransporter homolog [Protopterus annectens]|uniref:thymic stromal cotransporter homolog n=1 Tax=Protopterus annectens TaxID=7888 RepID=UPI001CF9C3F4|nr:thymic stromal cotransporter homolog [Protopterus annectens]